MSSIKDNTGCRVMEVLESNTGTAFLLNMLIGSSILLAIVYGIYWLDNNDKRSACQATAAAMGTSWTYESQIHCMIAVNGKMVPLEAYRVIGK